MSKKPETVFRDRIRPYLKALPNCALLPIQQASLRGYPDYILCLNGHFIALELKCSDKEKAQPLQRYTLDKIAGAGGFSFVVNPQNWQAVYKVLLQFSGGNHDKAKVLDV